MELGTGRQAQQSPLGPFGRGGGPSPYGTSGAGNFGMYRFPNRPAPAPTTQPAWTPPPQQAPPGPMSNAPQNTPMNWADPTAPSGAVSNPFTADNPYGSGAAFTNFYESHPGLAGMSNFADIRAQAPTIAGGGQFSNPYGQMRDWKNNMAPITNAGALGGIR